MLFIQMAGAEDHHKQWHKQMSNEEMAEDINHGKDDIENKGDAKEERK
jgi:hypothetical protein